MFLHGDAQTVMVRQVEHDTNVNFPNHLNECVVLVDSLLNLISLSLHFLQLQKSDNKQTHNLSLIKVYALTF